MDTPVAKPHLLGDESLTKRLPVIRLWPLGVVVLAFMIGNILLPQVFWRMYSNGWLHLIANFFLGALVAEVALLATWLALGPNPLITRLTITLPSAIAVTCTYILGLRLPGDNMPLWAALFVFGFEVGGYFLAAVPLFLYRHLSWRQITTCEAPLVGLDRETFGIRYLMLLTAIVAALLALSRAVFPHTSTASTGPAVLTAIAYVSPWALFTVMVLSANLWIAFDTRRRWQAGVCVLLLLVVLTPLHLSVLGYYRVINLNSKSVLLTYAYVVGFMVTTTTVLLIVRSLDFRLRKIVSHS